MTRDDVIHDRSVMISFVGWDQAGVLEDFIGSEANNSRYERCVGLSERNELKRDDIHYLVQSPCRSTAVIVVSSQDMPCHASLQ